MKMLITLEPLGLFGSNFVYLRLVNGKQNGDEASPSTIITMCG